MIDFGKYAAYIWPAFIASFLGFAWMIADSLLRSRYWRRKAEAAQQSRAED